MALPDLLAEQLVGGEQVGLSGLLQHGLVHGDDGIVAAHGGAGLHGFGVGLRGFVGGFQHQWVEQTEVGVLSVQDLFGHIIAIIAEIAGKHGGQMQAQALCAGVVVHAWAQCRRQAVQTGQIRVLHRLDE